MVQDAVVEAFADPVPFTGALELRLGFDLPRPLNHYLPVSTKRRAPELRATAPPWPIGPARHRQARPLHRRRPAPTPNSGSMIPRSSALVAAKRYIAWNGKPGVLITVSELS